MPARRRSAKRTEEFAEREARWSENKRKRDAELKHRFRREIVSFDTYGKPLGKGELTTEDITWSDVVAGLERAAQATGDPVFFDAIACLKNYGLDRGSPQHSYKRVHSEVYGDLVLDYLSNMKFLLERQPARYSSVRAAAEEVASSYFYNAVSFEAACDQLRKRFMLWKKEGFPKQRINVELGDVGYKVRVKPAAERKIPRPASFPISFLSDDGVDTPFTTYWRQRFVDGDVWISRSLG